MRGCIGVCMYICIYNTCVRVCTCVCVQVHGQLRALGTKQHLKAKYGSGYELTIKLNVSNLEEQMQRLTHFVQGLFPSAEVIGDNAGVSESFRMLISNSFEQRIEIEVQDLSFLIVQVYCCHVFIH